MPVQVRALPLLLALLSCASPPGAEDPSIDQASRAPEYAWVVFGADSVRAEVARTPSARERGLMFREAIPAGTGMLFVFPQPDVQGVWMQDTHVALDAVFIDEDATVLDIEPLEPGDPTVKYSPSPVLFVLEVPRGWLDAHGVEVGDTAVIVFEDPDAGGEAVSLLPRGDPTRFLPSRRAAS